MIKELFIEIKIITHLQSYESRPTFSYSNSRFGVVGCLHIQSDGCPSESRERSVF